MAGVAGSGQRRCHERTEGEEPREDVRLPPADGIQKGDGDDGGQPKASATLGCAERVAPGPDWFGTRRL